jgi:isoleucyl-tRNA synthetase
MSDEAEKTKYPVNLPRTDFPMKGNLTQLEPRMLAFWEEQKTYPALVDQARGSGMEPFTFPDGPPYANGHLHAGHALNKILKDIVVKHRNLTGRSCHYIPGYDTHGLPIEQAVEKRLKDKKVDKRSVPRDEFLALCRDYALEFIDIQTTEFKRLGVFGAWEQPYRTLDPSFEAAEIRALAAFAHRRQLYRQRRPVYFCVTDQTALAEAEVEYEDHISPSVYAAFRSRTEPPDWMKQPGGKSTPAGRAAAQNPRFQAGILRKDFPFLADKEVAFVIWTTTSWTLAANEGTAVHPKLEYAFYALGDRALVVAKDLLPSVLKAIAPEELAPRSVEVPAQVAGTVRPEEARDVGHAPHFSGEVLARPERLLGYALGEELLGYEYVHPFIPGKTGVVVPGEHVTLDAGSGLVHTAPGHGMEDYFTGLSFGLPIYNPVRPDGRYDETVVPELRGQHVFKVGPLVAELLEKAGALLNPKTDTVRHSYPHCWRCRQPVILSATFQWFIPMDFKAEGAAHTFREQVLAQVDRVQWVPEWGRSRIRGMLENRPDWCISRQRTWGVPIPIAYCASDTCGEPLLDPAIAVPLMQRVADATEQEGAGVWYRRPVEDFLPRGQICPRCGGKEFRRETDILDVWFDSACVFAAVSQKKLRFPADLYLEGSDQHRGWFHSSMLVSVGTEGVAPYRACLTHGFVVDGEGRKMSKSLGNTVGPEKVVQQYGAEVLRLWVASSDYRDDVRLSDQILKGLGEGYRKIRNTLRYALGNLYDFDPAQDSVRIEALLPLDRWALGRLEELTRRVRDAYDAYEFHLVYHAVVEFCAMDLSALYFDILKDRLYTAAPRGPARRSAQTVLHRTAQDLLRLLAPVMSFTAEEAWQHLPGKSGPSVFLAGFPTGVPTPRPDESALRERYERLFAVRSLVQGELEQARRDKQIGSSLEAKVLLSASGPTQTLLESAADELPFLFIVSQVQVGRTPSPAARALKLAGSDQTVAIEVQVADGSKCPRCWTYSTAIGPGEPLCLKCRAALAEAATDAKPA